MGGLAFRRNGSNISLTGQDYVSPSYGTMRLCVRDYNGNIVRYGFTSNTSASQYSPSFYINGTICHIGRVTSSTSQENVTVTNNYTSSRSSEYVYSSKRTTRNTTITNSSTITYTNKWSYVSYAQYTEIMTSAYTYTSFNGASTNSRSAATAYFFTRNTYSGTSSTSTQANKTASGVTKNSSSSYTGTYSAWGSYTRKNSTILEYATTTTIYGSWGVSQTSTSRSTQTASSTRSTTYYTYSTRSSQYNTSSTKATTSQAITSGHNINL